jgi:hypothetical protein
VPRCRNTGWDCTKFECCFHQSPASGRLRGGSNTYPMCLCLITKSFAPRALAKVAKR